MRRIGDIATNPSGGRSWALPTTGQTRADQRTLGISTAEPRPTSPPAYLCPLCKDAGFLRVPLGDPPGRLGNHTELCDCRKAGLSQRAWQRAKAASQLLPGLYQLSFGTFRRERQPAAFQAAADFAADPARSWLVLAGEHGTGKTHLLAAIVNRLLHTDAHPVYQLVPELLRHLQQGIAAGDYARRWEDVKRAEVLALDDLGKEQPSPWRDETLFVLLDFRWAMGLPTAVATNLKLADLPPALASRLADQARSKVVRMRPGDYRQSAERAAERDRAPAGPGGGVAGGGDGPVAGEEEVGFDTTPAPRAGVFPCAACGTPVEAAAGEVPACATHRALVRLVAGEVS